MCQPVSICPAVECAPGVAWGEVGATASARAAPPSRGYGGIRWSGHVLSPSRNDPAHVALACPPAARGAR